MTHEEMFADTSIKIGTAYRFDYPPEFTTLPEYTAHAGESVTALRPCTEDEAGVIWDDPDGTGERIVDRMFIIQAADGWIGHAWESELNPM